MQAYRQLRQYRFFLNAAKTDEHEIEVIIHELKSQRSFSRAIRVGLKLFWSLMAGRIDVLLEEFPWVKEQVEAVLTSELQAQLQATLTNELQEQLKRIEEKIPTPEELAIYRQSVPAPQTEGAHRVDVEELEGNPNTQEQPQNGMASTRQPRSKPLSQDQIADSLEIKTAEAPTVNSNYNFRLNMALSISGGVLEKMVLYLFKEDVVQAIQEGKLPQNALEVFYKSRKKFAKSRKKVAAPEPATVPLPPANAKRLQGSELELPPPDDFEDMLL